MKCLVVFNPIAGRGVIRRVVPSLLRRLEDRGIRTDCYETKHHGDALESVGKRASAYDFILCAGGDGTVNEVLNALALTDVPLLICPLGTGNVSAKELGIRFNNRSFFRILIEGYAIKYDLAIANGRFFFNMMGVGFDALVTYTYHQRRQGNMRMIEYLPLALSLYMDYEYPVLRARAGGISREAGFVIVANSSSYGGPFRFVPSASMRDGKVDACIMKGRRPRDFLRYAFSAFLNRMPELHDVELIRATEVLVDSDRRVPYQVDGDFAGWTPVRVEVVPRALNVIVPPGTPGAKKLW